MPFSVKLYKFLGYLLLPIAFVFGFFDIIFLISALANPEVLLFVFAIGSWICYILLSNRFCRKGILREQHLSKNFKDWINVNAIVSMILCCLFFIIGIQILTTSDAKLLQLIEEKAKTSPDIPADFDMKLLVTVTKNVSAVLLLTSFISLPHLFLTFRFLKKYSYLFEETL
jgi:hypothetical protein